ncbi:WXG100 family type VII secretion target [Mycolicibacterium sp. HK-90]|uniref:WXG100 family type VII secretion target n=1 Tax=Mycolicibacterium sp. HK-90 TaxID=3056937 RepID=UPI002659DC26|nr:WXG100 family type VII secretion target [Mycolicibacterium sp. HK-90]WKG03648.1 WXG100 family type VII secretion target [Mycolicibacterium sp. HK-90]
MGRSVDVVVSELHLAATRMQDAAQRLQDGLSSVDLETRELLGSGWKGDAASAFGKAWEQWHGGAGQVVRGLQTMSRLLTEAGNSYGQTDQQAAGTIGSSGQAMDGSSASAPGTSPSAPGTVGAAGPPGGSTDSAESSAAGVGAELAQQIPQLAQQMTAPVTQLGQVIGQLAQGLAQAGQTAAQIATQAAQQSGQDQPARAEEDGQKDDDESDKDKSSEGLEGDDDKQDAEGKQSHATAASDEQSTLHAPVETAVGESSRSGEQSRVRHDGGAAETSEI